MKILVRLQFSFFLCFILSFVSKANQNLHVYFENINKAELDIANQDYRGASEKYKIAFTNKENPFAIDLYNALITSLRLEDFDQSYTYCILLAEKGVGQNFFSKKSDFKKLRIKKRKDWNSLLILAADRKAKYDRDNKEINNKLAILYKRDQEIHALLRSNPENIPDPEIEVKRVDDSTSFELMALFQEYGFLSEFNLGAPITDDTVILKQPNFYIIIRHNFQGLIRYDTLFAGTCRKAIQQGEMDPMVYAVMRDANGINGNIDYGTSHIVMKYNCAIYMDRDMYKRYTSKDLKFKHIDSNRKSIYLPPMEDALNKLIFRIRKPDSPFIIRDTYGIIGSFAEKRDEEIFLKDNIVFFDPCKSK